MSAQTNAMVPLPRVSAEAILISFLQQHGPTVLEVLRRHMEDAGYSWDAIKQAASRARTRGLVVTETKKNITTYALSDATFLTPVEKLQILEAVSGRGRPYPVTLARAAEHAGVTLSDIVLARMRDRDFDTQLKFAEQEGTQSLEDEATRRAVVGVEEYVMFQGQVCYETDPATGRFKKDEDGNFIPMKKVVYSDGLLTKLLQARDPGRFKDQRIEHTGAGGGALRVFLGDCSDD